MIMALLLPVLIRTGIFIHFKINQDHISMEVCSKRDEPVNTCNGKCYLSKELKQVNENEHNKELPNHNLLDLNITLFCKQNSTINPFVEEDSMIHQSLYCQSIYNSPHLEGIFKPPRIALV